MNLATDVYINRVNNCRCGDSVIHLYRGADSHLQQGTRKYFLLYVKGTKKQKESLKLEKLDLYSYFDTVWQLKERHSIKNLPSQYAFVVWIHHAVIHYVEVDINNYLSGIVEDH